MPLVAVQNEALRSKTLDDSHDDLLHRFTERCQRACGRWRRPPYLTDGKPLGDGLGAQPQINRKPGHLVLPDILFETMRDKTSGT